MGTAGAGRAAVEPRGNGDLERRVVILREAWIRRVSEFIASAGIKASAEDGGSAEDPDKPQIFYSRLQLPLRQSHFSDFNIRSRHFHCAETFFLEIDPSDRLLSVVGTDGLLSRKRSLSLSLLVARDVGANRVEWLRRLFQGVLEVANRYTPTRKLRFSYIYDSNFRSPLGCQVDDLLLDPVEETRLQEEFRIANETGKGREAVLFGFSAA